MKEIEEEKKRKLYELRQNQRVYAKMVKEVHVPKISKEKQFEISQIRDSYNE